MKKTLKELQTEYEEKVMFHKQFLVIAEGYKQAAERLEQDIQKEKKDGGYN